MGLSVVIIGNSCSETARETNAGDASVSERFYCEQPIAGDNAELLGSEAHHLLHVMRLKPGGRVTLFDGSGAEFDAQIAECGRSVVQLAVLARNEVDRERAAPIVLGIALPKGDRQKVLVEKLTELGVTRLTPLLTERSVARLSSGGLEKLRRGVVEASKQCGRNVLMKIGQPVELCEFLASASSESRRLIAHPGGAPFAAIGAEEGLACAVGPEGGFSDAEVEQTLAAGWKSVSLGPTILRVETASIALAAAVGVQPSGC